MHPNDNATPAKYFVDLLLFTILVLKKLLRFISVCLSVCLSELLWAQLVIFILIIVKVCTVGLGP